MVRLATRSGRAQPSVPRDDQARAAAFAGEVFELCLVWHLDEVRHRAAIALGVSAPPSQARRARMIARQSPRRVIRGLRFAKADDPQEPVVCRVDDGHSVGELFRRIDSVSMADRDVWGRRTKGSLSRLSGGTKTGHAERYRKSLSSDHFEDILDRRDHWRAAHLARAPR